MFSQRLAAASFCFLLMRSCFFCCLREVDEAPEVWRFIPVVVGVKERFLPGRRRCLVVTLIFEFIVIAAKSGVRVDGEEAEVECNRSECVVEKRPLRSEGHYSLEFELRADYSHA
jgi:hypothetical protein